MEYSTRTPCAVPQFSAVQCVWWLSCANSKWVEPMNQ